MVIEVKHKFTSSKADGADSTLIRPSNWNDTHTLNIAGFSLVGKATANQGAAQEITLGAGLEFSGSTLRAGGSPQFVQVKASPGGGGGFAITNGTQIHESANRTIMKAWYDRLNLRTGDSDTNILDIRNDDDTITFKTWQVWHGGNFNPASKADLSGATFTGSIRVLGDNAVFTGGASGRAYIASSDSSTNIIAANNRLRVWTDSVSTAMFVDFNAFTNSYILGGSEVVRENSTAWFRSQMASAGNMNIGAYTLARQGSETPAGTWSNKGTFTNVGNLYQRIA